jgi:hypothetical protein
MSSPDDVLSALRDFVSRLDQLDPQAPPAGELIVGTGGTADRFPLREPVARALVEALRSYHDPRDFGSCAHCATGRLDENLTCRSCGIIQGVFGRMIAERFPREIP